MQKGNINTYLKVNEERKSSSVSFYALPIEYQNKSLCPQTMSSKGPETGTCLEVPAGSHYSVKFRAKPNGSIYSGFWSDWSNVLTGDTPADTGEIPVRRTAVKHLVITIILYKIIKSCTNAYIYLLILKY